jgi:high affinity sulfate transporter 1
MASQESEAPLSHGIQRWVPGIAMIKSYKRAWLRFDLVAGLVLAAILVPQGLAYAELAGVPAVTGLYTTVACLIAYAIMGASRVLVLGPDSSVSPLIYAAIIPLAAGGDPETIVALAGMLALMVGLIEIGLGVGKLGFIADLLSKEVQAGYMNGLAITIIVGQLPKLFGFSTDADGFFEDLWAFFTNLDLTNTATLLVGLATLAVMLILPRVTKKIPAVLVAVGGATIVSAVLNLAEDYGVKTVGVLPSGFPVPSFPVVDLSDIPVLFAAALGIVLVSLADTIATSTSFAARRGDEVDPNQEMIGVGSANIAAGLFQGFAISVSGSRTAVAEQSGAKSQVTGLVGAGVVLALLLFFPALLKDLPQTALAAVVIAASFSLADLGVLRTYWRVRKTSLILSLVATIGVVLFGVLQGILVAVVLAVILFFRRSWWPPGEVLGHDAETGWHSLKRFPDGAEIPGVLVFRWEAPLFFANAGIFRQQVRQLVRQRKPRWLVLQCEAITDIDVTAADMLKTLDLELNARGIHLAFVELRGRLQDLILRYGLYETLDREHFYESLPLALEAIAAEDRETETSTAG